MTHYWRAEVTVTGVHAVTDDEFERVNDAVQGVIRLDTHNGTLYLKWRFANESPDTWDAIGRVSTTWRKAVDLIENAADPVCTDFRVHRVEGL